MLIQERICNFAKTKNATTEKEMNNCLNCLTTLLLLCWNLLATNAKTDEMRTVTVNGATRAYWLYVPDKVSTPAPLVLSLHGTGGHAADKSPFRTTVADQEGCIVAYPQGEDIFFPVFGSTLPGWHATGENSNDIEFFKAVIDDVAAHFSIDRKRVYCCGFSNGGMMAYTAACVASDMFAAFASISGYPINEFHLHQTSVRPVPFLHIHGKADDFVRYRHMPVIVDNMVARNGCNPVPKKIRGTDYDKSVYEATEGCFPYVYYEIDNMGHCDFTTQTEDGNSAMTMWKFMSQYTLNSPCDTTIIWEPHIEAEGWNPTAHGFVLDNGTTLLNFGGEQSTWDNQNVYHSLQLNAGRYQLSLRAECHIPANITIQLKSIADGKTYLNKTMSCGDVTVDFSVDKNWAEYQLTILRSSALEAIKISNISIHAAKTSTGIATITENGQKSARYYTLNGNKANASQSGIIIRQQSGKTMKLIRE
ncbi:prolyl oligopeptidase family serine peptidase [Prevotellaceae bacterium LKV-178-WT-2A]|uniref:Prolyl oligopeptidase family serine peptidase n=2 Tax=Hallella mizrahii TaxID=2606637 RepID=A0A7K0KG00_9BACT|nr:prolyl oligopeptidase family serine peptidase [Hallella mizrahii]